MRRRAVLAGLAVALAGCTHSGSKQPGATLTVVVSAPITQSPWVAESLVRGAKLGVDEVNAAGGVQVGKTRYALRLVELDHANSVTQAQANARRAVRDGAIALVTDGVGAVAVAGVTGPAHLPTLVTFEGGQDIVDETARPTLFRMAPANKPMCVRLTDYLAGRKPRIALLTDDSGYGRDGRRDLTRAIRRDSLTLVSSVELASGADPAPQVLRAQQSGADTVLLWAKAPVVAATIATIRGRGWAVPVYAGPTAEDPLVRQQLAAHPHYLDGVSFVSFRMTAEVGPKPFATFRAAYEKAYGPDRIGVTAGGRPVVMPPDWAMYGYDSIRLLAKAYGVAKAPGAPLVAALNAVSVTGANGDERGFLPGNHEGVSPDDMYVATFQDMRFVPVRDDLLSRSLPPVPQ